MSIAARPQYRHQASPPGTERTMFAPEDDGYDDAHQLFIPVYDGVRPAAVAQVADASDIATVLTVAGRPASSSLFAVAGTAPPDTAPPMAGSWSI